LKATTLTENIFAIHGAWSSPVSFNYLQTQVDANWTTLSYDHTRDGMRDIIYNANMKLDRPCTVIGHSLGGIVALHLHDNPFVERIITLASPLAGLELNLIQLYFSRSNLIGQIAKDSHIIKDMKRATYTKPIIHLVAANGFNPFIYEDNDGVLPVKIQTSWGCGEFYKIDSNHYEILQHADTVAAIREFG
jgi:pimeloyl-ACP methyl ester carboxylesterase